MHKKSKTPPVWPSTLPQRPDAWTETEFELPNETVGNENAYRANRLRLFRSPDFRKAIVDLQKKYPALYWKDETIRRRAVGNLDRIVFKSANDLLLKKWKEIQKHRMSVKLPNVGYLFRQEAAQLLSEWGINVAGGWRWPEWLIRNWVPNDKNYRLSTQSQLTYDLISFRGIFR